MRGLKLDGMSLLIFRGFDTGQSSHRNTSRSPALAPLTRSFIAVIYCRIVRDQYNQLWAANLPVYPYHELPCHQVLTARFVGGISEDGYVILTPWESLYTRGKLRLVHNVAMRQVLILTYEHLSQQVRVNDSTREFQVCAIPLLGQGRIMKTDQQSLFAHKLDIVSGRQDDDKWNLSRRVTYHILRHLNVGMLWPICRVFHSSDLYSMSDQVTANGRYIRERNMPRVLDMSRKEPIWAQLYPHLCNITHILFPSYGHRKDLSSRVLFSACEALTCRLQKF